MNPLFEKIIDQKAEEIATMIKEFIVWKDNFVDFDIETQLYAVTVETHVIEWKSLEETFDYWLINIKK
jgi:hypothetical protein